MDWSSLYAQPAHHGGIVLSRADLMDRFLCLRRNRRHSEEHSHLVKDEFRRDLDRIPEPRSLTVLESSFLNGEVGWSRRICRKVHRPRPNSQLSLPWSE